MAQLFIALAVCAVALAFSDAETSAANPPALDKLSRGEYIGTLDRPNNYGNFIRSVSGKNDRALDKIGGGEYIRALAGHLDDRGLDKISGGEFIRSLDKIGGGEYLRSLDKIGGGEYLRSLDKRALDSLSGMAFGGSKRFDSLSGLSFGAPIKRWYGHGDFDEIDNVGWPGFTKRNFDEIDRSGFGGFFKRSAGKREAKA